MALHAVFTQEGIPGWIGFNARPDSEELPEKIRIGGEDVNVTVELLAGLLRDPANGRWKKRPRPPAPTPEEREAERLRRQEERRLERQAARRRDKDAARRERLFDRLVAVAERIDPDFAAEVAKLEEEFKDEEE